LDKNQVFTGEKIREFGNEIGLELHGSLAQDDGTYSNFYGDDIVLFLENLSRITRTPLEEVLNTHSFAVPDTERSANIIRKMREYKLKEGLYDFTDMIEEFIKQDDAPLLEVLIVDEAQDLSELQWLMVTLLSRNVKRMYVAGDDDQTIFTWAGASERFISMQGKVETLKQSFRVPEAVQVLALRIIEQISNRRHKVWNSREAEGSVSYLEDVSRLTPLVRGDRDTMMLARTVKMLRQKFVPYCRSSGLPFRYFEYNSIRLTHAEAITAWNDLQEGSAVPANLVTRVYDLLPAEGHKKKKGLVKRGYKAQLNRIADQADPPMLRLQELKNDYGLLAEGTWNEVFTEIEPQEVTYIQKVLDNGFDLTAKPKIHISTIHRVKGGQADMVVLLSDAAKAAEKSFIDNQDEETRILYTGITRTFEDLVIVQPYTRHYYGSLFE
jgi:superfamily I DNA/RNA helicase